MATSPRKRRVPGPVLDFIRDRRLRGWEPGQIVKGLDTEFADHPDWLPTSRTVQRIVKELEPAKPSSPWRLVDAAPEDAAVIVPVLAELVIWSRGLVHQLSEVEAAAVLRLRTVFPELPSWAVYALAVSYAAAGDNEHDQAVLDSTVAFTPWRSPEHLERYRSALDEYRVRESRHFDAVSVRWLSERGWKGDEFVPEAVMDRLVGLIGASVDAPEDGSALRRPATDAWADQPMPPDPWLNEPTTQAEVKRDHS